MHQQHCLFAFKKRLLHSAVQLQKHPHLYHSRPIKFIHINTPQTRDCTTMYMLKRNELMSHTESENIDNQARSVVIYCISLCKVGASTHQLMFTRVQ